MPAFLGGSVVDQSLLRQAADRGVTICFADLDGADGLWVPEERTVLVNRGLSDARVAEVIEHELAHVRIDDQHADLDAGEDVLAGRPPSRSRRPETVALAAALGLVAVVGGVMYGISTARGDIKLDRVAPTNGPGLSADESPDLKPSLSPSRAPGGGIVTVTVTASAPTASTTGSPTMPPNASATATRPVPTSTPTRSRVGAPPAPPPTTVAPVPPTTEAPAQTTPPADPTTVPPTTPPAGSASGVGDTGDQLGSTDPTPVGTDPGTVADATDAGESVDSTPGP